MPALDVSGVRRMMGDLAADLSDDEIRLALVRLALDRHGDDPASDEVVAEGIRRFADAMRRAEAP